MRDDHEGDAGLVLDVGDLELRLLAQLLVERAERLVEQQNLGLPGERPRESHALALAAGKLVRLALRERRQLHEIEHLPDPVAALGLGHGLVLEAIADILLHAHMREERVGLEHHVHRPVIGRHVRHVLTVDEDLAARGRLEAREHAQQRRLAAARSAEKGEELALDDVDRHIVDGREVTELLGDLLDADEGRRGRRY